MKKKSKKIVLILATLLSFQFTYCCTIVSVKDKNGLVWNLNNEDGPYGVANFLNVFPKTKGIKFGYYTLSYFSPEFGNGGSMQGGMNEAGLTFDFNAIDAVRDFDPSTKTAFPDGDNAILPHILGNMSTVNEVVDFFSTYWFQHGFTTAQMHVADKNGTFAIISPSGIKVQTKDQPLISTNFDICGNESSDTCWRYPIVESKLKNEEINLLTLMDIALDTRQKNGTTMYTNIQNLSTGDIWLFSQHDPNVVIDTNIQSLLDKGQKSYTFSDLKSFTESSTNYSWEKTKTINLTLTQKKKYVGTYHNSFIGEVIVRNNQQGLELLFADGTREVFQPTSENRFRLLDADINIEFSFDKRADQMALYLYENGFWSFKAWLLK